MDMHLRLLSILLGLGAACAAHAAVIYKWTDADGVVHYSDRAVPGAEKLVTSSSSSNGVGGPTRSSSSPPGGALPRLGSGVSAGLGYEKMSIQSPNPEQVFFGDEPVPVRLDLEPQLKTGQTITWQLNGKTLDEEQNLTAFTLKSLARGAYSVTATVSDQSSGAAQSTATVNFNVRQPSELAPLNRNRH
jgi:Domain of unknown function (DUF4124)